MMDYYLFDVKAIQVKREQRLRSLVMDGRKVAGRAERWSLMLDESEQGHYTPGRCIIGTARQTWHVKSLLNLHLGGPRCAQSSPIAFTRESDGAASFHLALKNWKWTKSNKLLIQVIMLNCLHFVSHWSQLFWSPSNTHHTSPPTETGLDQTNSDMMEGGSAAAPWQLRRFGHICKQPNEHWITARDVFIKM